MRLRRNVRGIVSSTLSGEPRFLLLLARKGYWQCPNGGMDDGESEVQALIREIAEETGLLRVKVLEETRTTREYDAERHGEPIHVMLAAYLVEADMAETVTIGNSEDRHLESRWVAYDEALTMLNRYPEQRPVFEEVCKKGGLVR
ncbi:MAG: NUDIX domain-containing protein [Nitrospirota bacterium]|nr:NUDIX domain-containing protein [Nitrospirota bacterium]